MNQKPTYVLGVTKRCNLGCPICYGDTRVLPIIPHVAMAGVADQPLAVIASWYDAIGEKIAAANIAAADVHILISGGEPTYRADISNIVAQGREKGFTDLSLQTNGLRLAERPRLAEELVEAGLSRVFLQFDGTTDEIYQALRGKPLLAIKRRAIEACALAQLPVILLTTVVGGLNENDLVDIICYGADHSPAVHGLRFQPLVVTQQCKLPAGTSALTLDETLSLIEEQSAGLLQAGDFVISAGGGEIGCECTPQGAFVIEGLHDEPVPYCEYRFV
jgi:uncharacterized radical SAM superfamily Fe-S cluster-containing enzyme